MIILVDQSDEKNIRRRVYDALNVLLALDVIAKDKKKIHWKGLPNTNIKDLDKIKVGKRPYSRPFK
jgi:transcription factor Dp-1